MNINVSSYSTLSSRKGLSGLVSGLDTEELIEQMTAVTRQKITTQLQKQQIAIWKRDAYRAISTKLTDFNNKYFSYTNASTNILSSKFFNTSTVNSSSSYVKVTGTSTNTEGVKIKNISQLATKASFTSNHQVSNELMQSGSISETWKDTSLAGNSLTIGYGGKTYSLSLAKDFYLNSNSSDADHTQAVMDALNSSIGANADLKGKLEFSVNADNKIELNQIGEESAKTNDLRLEGGSINLLSSLGLYASPADDGAGNKPVYAVIAGTDTINASGFFETNQMAGASLSLEINGSKQTLTIDAGFRFTGAALARDASGKFTDDAKTAQAEQLQQALSAAIKKNSQLNGTDAEDVSDDLLKAEIAYDDTGYKLTLTAQNAASGNATIKVTGGSAELLSGLGLTANTTATAGESLTGSDLATETLLLQKDNSLAKSLSGSSLTVNLNGVSKTIEFLESDKETYATLAGTGNNDGLANYIQQKLDKSYGSGRVAVSLSDDGSNQLIFQTADESSLFSITNASASGILGENAALHIASGESNRVEFTKTLKQLQSEFTTKLTPSPEDGGEYQISVNGTNFTFSSSATLNDVINKINNDASANITLSYSSITNSFNAVSKTTGAQNTIEIADVSGNLSKVLFGNANDPATTEDDATANYTVTNGTDLKLSMSFDGGKTYTDVTRSQNNFTIDGLSYEILGKADNTLDEEGNTVDTEENISFTVSSNTDDLYQKISDFITAYNDIISTIYGKLTETKYGRESATDTEVYLPLTDDEKEEMSDKEIEAWEEKAKTGLLRNDTALSSILNNLRKSMTSVVSGTTDALYQIGISTEAYSWDTGGKLVIDETKLKAALAENPERVTSMFTSPDTGISYRLKSVLNDAVMGNEKGDGLLIQIAGKANSLTTDQSSLSKSISDMSDRLSTLRDRLEAEEDRYWSKFSVLEQYLSAMNAQSSWLTSLFSNNSDS